MHAHGSPLERLARRGGPRCIIRDFFPRSCSPRSALDTRRCQISHVTDIPKRWGSPFCGLQHRITQWVGGLALFYIPHRALGGFSYSTWHVDAVRLSCRRFKFCRVAIRRWRSVVLRVRSIAEIRADFYISIGAGQNTANSAIAFVETAFARLHAHFFSPTLHNYLPRAYPRRYSTRDLSVP